MTALSANMARPQSPRFPHLDGSRSKIRSKEYLLALLAGLIVLAYVFFSRQTNGLRPPPTAAKQDEMAATSTSSQQEPVTVTVTVTPSAPTPVQSGEGGFSMVAPGRPSGSLSGGGSSMLDTPSNLAADRPVAVIIESAVIPNLIPLMLHFTTVLGPAWGMILFTLEDRWIEPLSPAFQRHLETGRIEVRFLSPDTELTSSAAVSRFLTSPWIWEQVAIAKRVLLFQSDSVLCSKSEAAVEDYFKFDFAGAPIAAVYGAGFNGGLSVRNPRLFLQIAREVDFMSSGHKFEDQFFYEELKKRGAEMPAEEEAKTFAVETIFYETPLGYHQPQRWQALNMPVIEEWCPEVKMLVGRRAQ